MQSLSDEDSATENSRLASSPAVFLPSQYDCDEVINHESQFLTPDNRPLESSAVTLMKSMIFDTPPAVLAFQITRIDLELLKIAVSTNICHGVNSGLELITLPQGRWLRQDVIERLVIRLLSACLIYRFHFDFIFIFLGGVQGTCVNTLRMLYSVDLHTLFWT